METVNTVRISASKRKALMCYQSCPIDSKKLKTSCLKNKASTCSCVCQSCSNYSGKPLLENYPNFLKSGSPKCLMYLYKGKWGKFSEKVMDIMKEAFRTRSSAAKFLIGHNNYFVDFLNMLMINLNTGIQGSIAWIDESGKYFYPKCVIDSDEMILSVRERDLDVENCTGESENSHGKDKDAASISWAGCNQKNQLIKEVQEDNVFFVSPDFCFEPSNEQLFRLEISSPHYLFVQEAFILGLSPFATPSNIIGIYQISAKNALSRLSSFEKQIDFTKTCRGDANVRWAWYGSSKESLVRSILHGFTVNETPSMGSYGAGVYLSPECCAYMSATKCDVDEKGVQHMLLCRVIMGNMEQVHEDTEQFHPSSKDFDSGVDDTVNPKLYVIWDTHMNTHIYPEYVVCFHLPHAVQEKLVALNRIPSNSGSLSSRNLQTTASSLHPVTAENPPASLSGTAKMPTSGWLPMTMLFAAIQNSISPRAQDLVDYHYNSYKSKRITRDELIKNLKSTVGEELLISTLLRLQYHSPPVHKVVDQKKLAE